MIEQTEDLVEAEQIAQVVQEIENLRSVIDEAAGIQQDRLLAMSDDVRYSHEGDALETNIDRIRSISDHLGELAELIAEANFENGENK